MDKSYWIWLQIALGEGARFKEIIEYFGSIENLYKSNILEWKMSSVLTPKQTENLRRFSLDDTQQIIYDCENNGWQIITYDDKQYPQRLREIPNPPAVLYCDGALPDVDNSVCIGMVGTRKASSYALKVTSLMAKAVGECNAVVISGGALGVDSAAHKGAISAGAKTIAVLGCGLGTNYLNSNSTLRNKIKQNGALITEFQPFAKASKFTFPLRNRIISGLSLGVLVAEAGVKSGSLITARYAAEQNRDIFALPASVLDFNFAGSNKLIDDGATVVTSPSVLLEPYCQRYSTVDMSKMKTLEELLAQERDKGANLPKEEKQFTFDNIVQDRRERVKKTSAVLELKDNEKAVYDALDESFTHIDEISQRCNMQSKDVLSVLTMLEIKGIVTSTSGKRYKIS